MLCRFKSAPFALISPLWSRVRLSLSGTERETPLKMEISLYKCQFPLQKGYFYSVFGVSPVSAVSQNNELKILNNELKTKEAYLGWHILVSHSGPYSGPQSTPLLHTSHCAQALQT